MAEPVEAVRALLATTLSSESVRAGFMQQDGDRGVWVVASGGFSPVQELGTGYAWHQPRVRVFVRVGPRDHASLEALVASARAALNQNAPTGYTRCVVEGDVVPFPPDEYGRHAAVFAALLTIRE